MVATPTTDEIRDAWVDRALSGLSRPQALALVPEYQEAFSAWLSEQQRPVVVLYDERNP